MQIGMAICDDDRVFLNNISDAIKKDSEKLDIQPQIYLCDSGEQLLNLIGDEKKKLSVVFLDIDMPGMSGLEVARKIRDSKSKIILIFISAHEQYVFESIEYTPFRYIRKNRVSQELFRALKSVYERLKTEEDHSIVVKTEDGKEKITHSEIIYYEVESRKLSIYLKSRGKLVTRKTIKELYNEMNDDFFVKIHSGCAVNVRCIEAFSNFDITLINGRKLPVSRRRMKEIKSTILQYWRDRV